MLLDVIADRVLLPVDRLFTAGEPDRLALATMEVLRRNLVPLRVLEPWIARLAAAAGTARVVRRPRPVPAPAATPRRSCARSTSSSRSAPEPPEVRSDLLLVLVDALQATNPHYLRRTRRAPVARLTVGSLPP